MHRQYEAMRAHFVDALPIAEVAQRFGYKKGTVYNMVAAFRKSQTIDHFRSPGSGPKPKSKRATIQQRDARILELRTKEHLTNAQIHARLKKEKLPAGINTIGRVIREAGLPRLKRHYFGQEQQVIHAPPADRRQYNTANHQFHTKFGGLFLFVKDLITTDLEAMVAHMPGSQQLPAACAIRSLLALKLWGIGRPSHLMPYILDEGPPLFAGLNVLPKKSTLTEYSTRMDLAHLDALMDAWAAKAHSLVGECSGSLDVDFHTIPYHGTSDTVQSHDVSKRSRRQRGILALVACDARQRALVYADATITRETRWDAIMGFVEAWKKRTGQLPEELVFDSRFTTYANLGKLTDRNIRFLTLQRRFRPLIEQINAQPAEAWRTVTLHNIGQAYRKPRVLEAYVHLRNCPQPIRQLAIKGLGHEKPTVLITNDRQTNAADLIDRYARRMLVENAIEEAVNFFHMDALSAAVPLRIDPDLQLTVMASALYRMMARRLGALHAPMKARNLFRTMVDAPAKVITTEDQIVVRFGRRANNNTLRNAGYVGMQGRVPWLSNRKLLLEYD